VVLRRVVVDEACEFGGVDTFDGASDSDREGGKRSFNPVFCGPLLLSASDMLLKEEEGLWPLLLLPLSVSLSLILSFSGETSGSERLSSSSGSGSDSDSVSRAFLAFSLAFSRFCPLRWRSRSLPAFFRSFAGLYCSTAGDGGRSAWETGRSFTLGRPTWGPLRFRIEEKCSQS